MKFKPRLERPLSILAFGKADIGVPADPSSGFQRLVRSLSWRTLVSMFSGVIFVASLVAILENGQKIAKRY